MIVNRKKTFFFILLMTLFCVAFAAEKNDLLNFRWSKNKVAIAPNLAQQPLAAIDTGISGEINDLLSIVYALDRYKQDHGSYPVSSSGGTRWDGIISIYGESREDWIRGLVPKYLDSLPRDPRMLDDDGTRQYIYKSDGANYKLIVHRAANCQLIKSSYPSMVDPRRDCFSFGFWTKRASLW